MQQVWRPLLWAVLVSAVVVAVLLFVVVRFVLPEPTREPAPPRYTIGVWEGQVAVFEGTQMTPTQVFDVAVSTLPEDLRRQIAQGVPAYNEAQLSVLLEDYTS
ncbi:MAG: hypothetical protein E7527_01610 [Ruminococcaceae bacterium]|nr:hypothetical protein [Oscillospiraceae bacterium]